MSDEHPTPPAGLPMEVATALSESTAKRLRDIATYADALADHKEREGRLGDAADSDEVDKGDNDEAGNADERPDEFPDGVPTKATLTIKKINDNRYVCWQWRDGDRIKSKYKGPVDSER